MKGIKVRNRTQMKLLQNNTDNRNRRTSAFSAFGKGKLYRDKVRKIKTRQQQMRDESYGEADLVYDELKEAESRLASGGGSAAKKAGSMAVRSGRDSIKRISESRSAGNTVARTESIKQFSEKARASYQKSSHIQNVTSAKGVSGKGRLRLKQKNAKRIAIKKQGVMGKVFIIGAIAIVIFVCLFSAAASGILSSIDMSKGQDNITSAYLYLGTLEAKKGKLSGTGVTIDAEPMMAYMIAEYSITSDFDEKQKAQFTKVYNAINAKGYQSDTNKFFNTFHEDVFSSSAKYEVYKKLMAEGIYTQFKTMGSPFIGKDWVSKITSSWGWRIHPISGRLKLHKGLDIGMPAGTPINAICSGTVTSAGWNGGYGKCVTVMYENGDTKLTVLYAHMSSISVRQGMKIGEGTVVGKVGTTGDSTGNHLHIEIMAGGYSNDVTKLFYPRIYMIEREVENVKKDQ